jgi:hypothetical protein
MEFFIHPWYMAAGGALISSPILIHLINRMRFKRIRWAAMEFLLKSQKRNRRRLIIEQMILLLLRILLVLLAAFLVARFLFGGQAGRGAQHVIILDDTLSMSDKGLAGGKDTTAFAVGQEQVLAIADKASQASSEQFMKVYLLSEMDKPVWEGRLSRESRGLIERAFQKRALKPTLMHVSPRAALEHGRGLLGDKQQQPTRILHLVSDFRDPDWTTGADADKLGGLVREIVEDEINLNLIDVAAPFRTRAARVVQNHDNLAIVDFKPDTRVAVEDAQVEFTVTIQNFGDTAPQPPPFLKVKVNGQVDHTRSQQTAAIPPNSKIDHKFTLAFPLKAKAGTQITEKDGTEERERKRRLQREFFHVRVDIGPEKSGLNADNVRDIVIEVRKKVPTLVVDGTKFENRTDGSDRHIFESFYAASGEYDIEERKLQDLEKTDLDLYPSIVLLNVAEIPDNVLAKLKSYVEQGGSLCYFLGEEVKADHYNTKLFKAGLFPVLIGDRPFDPLMAQGMSDPDDRKRERIRKRQSDPTPKILFPNPKHPVVRTLHAVRSCFRYLSIDVYWQAAPRAQWDPDGRQTESLIVLPNTSSIDKYKDRVRGLVMQAIGQLDKIAAKEVEMKRFVEPLQNHWAGRDKVRDALAAGELFRVAERLDEMLNDPGVKDDASRPPMPELWGHVGMKALRDQIREFRETILYGDPLLVSRRLGKGRVVAMLTPVGTTARRGVGGEELVSWNNWAAGEKVVSTWYPLFMMDLQRYLISEGQAPNRLVGETIAFPLDPKRYERKYSYKFLGQPDMELAGQKDGDKVEEEKGKGEMAVQKDKTLAFNFKDTRRPGILTVDLTLVGEGPEDERKETRAYAFNVDALKESNLKRADKDRLDQSQSFRSSGKGSLALLVPGDSFDAFKERVPDASESPWLYLFFIIILIVEQAMAVHLSFHLKGSEAAPAAPVAARAPVAA